MDEYTYSGTEDNKLSTMEMQLDDDGIPFVMWGGNKIRLEVEPVTDKNLLEKAENELRERPEVVEKALIELRNILEEEKSLYIPIDNDEFLMKFLRPCKFYAESAFKRIQSYYKFRRTYVEYCRDLVPSAARSTFENSSISILSPRDQHGRRILVVDSGERWNPRIVSVKDMFRGTQLGLEAAMTEPQTQICGVIGLFDMKGLSFTHIMQFTPSYAKMIMEWIQDCIPIRLKAVHIVNQPYIFNMLFAIFKPFMSQKLRSRIHFHGSNMDSLRTHIDPEVLRKRHGGLLPEPEISGEVLWQMLNYYEEEFKLANSYGYITNNNK